MSNIEIQQRYMESSEARLLQAQFNPWKGEGINLDKNNFDRTLPNALTKAGLSFVAASRILDGKVNGEIRSTGEEKIYVEDQNQRPSSKEITRRRLLQLGAGAFVGLAGGRLFEGGSRVVSAQERENDYATPSPTPESDDRLHNVQSTQITRDELLMTNPPHLPIESISLNPNFSEAEARNRIDLAMVNGLIRAHAVSQNYLVGQDYSPMLEYLKAGNIPDEPNWDEYFEKIKSDEELIFPMMALSLDDPTDGAYVDWKDVDIRKGVNLNFVGEEALIGAFGQPNGMQEMGFTYRVSDEKELQIDIYTNFSVMEQYFTDMQQSYNTGATMTTLLALQSLSNTLGIVDHKKQGALFNLYITAPQYDYVMNAGKENFPRSFYREQDKLIMGDPYLNAQGFAEYFPNSILYVNSPAIE